MVHKVRLSNIWIYIPLAIILTLGSLFVSITQFDIKKKDISSLLLLPIPIITIIVSGIVSSKQGRIELNDNSIVINGLKTIYLKNIDWYYEDSNFLFDGIQVRCKDGSRHYLSSLVLFNKNNNLTFLKDKIQSWSNPISEKQIVKRELRDFASYKIYEVSLNIKFFILISFLLIIYFSYIFNHIR